MNLSLRALAFTLCGAAAILSAGLTASPAMADAAAPRLYALDCGHLELESLALFEDTDAYERTPGSMAVPCFLIRHPAGDLLWDTGLTDKLAEAGGPVTLVPGVTGEVTAGLLAQLSQLSLTPGDIEFVALSHLHFDHSGNAGLFPQATFLVDRNGLDWARGEPTPFGVDLNTLTVLDTAARRLLELDEDVFGDGTVRLLRAPGHTPGHRILMLQLQHAGTVILSGDLYHTRDNYRFSRVPVFNESRADTLASFDRVQGLLRHHAARLVIQHAPEDFAALPAFPDYLD